MALKPVVPSRRAKTVQAQPSSHALELLRALSDAAQSHHEGQVLAEHVLERYGLACVVLARAARGWQVVGSAGLPPPDEAGATQLAQLGMAVPATVEPERWLGEGGAPWTRRDLTHGRRTVARLLVQAARVPDDLARACNVAGPLLAAAYPRQAGTTALELYLSQIVHDLRQPLNTLKIAHTLMTGAEPRVIERCQRAVRDLADLMDDLLSFAAPPSKSRRGHLPVRLAELVTQLVEDHAPQARSRDVDLVLQVRADPTVLGSPLGLRRALTNVIDNAVEHTPAGGKVEIRVDVDFHDTLVEVRDGGPGVPSSLREQVFEPFFTTRSNGNGLGLPVVRLVAQSHGGTARFVDSPQGACLRFAIPHQPSANGLPV
jgi:signal transduction histidine kinase